MSLDLFAPVTLEPGLLPVFILLAVQIALGGLDNLLHHEMTEALPTRPNARYELTLHSVRELIYAGVFAVFALLQPTGLWAMTLAVVLLAEIAITLADFIEEDRTRALPPLERILHTVLALNYGAVLALLAPVLWSWAQDVTALTPVSRGLWTPLFLVAAVGVGLWGLRDSWAALTLRPVATEKPKPSGRTVLVTGATGFLGREVIGDLLARGDDVIALTRNARKARRILGPDVHAITDLEVIDGDARIHAIINLAGANVADQLWSRARKRTLIQSRMKTTRDVTTLIKRLRWTPEVLVSASAVGVYGDGGEAELTEATPPPTGVFAAELCKMWEAAAGEAELHGVRTVRLRFGLVFGPGGGAFPRLAMTRPLGVLARFGSGRQWMAWIHKADAVGLIHHALRTETLSGPVNAVAPTPARHGTVIESLAAPRRLVLPIPAALLQWGLGEMSQLFLASQRVMATKATASGYRFEYQDIDTAVDALTSPTLPKGDPRHA